jgi:hypothetical protein
MSLAFSISRGHRMALFAIAGLALAVTVACGGANSGNTTTPPPPAGNTRAQVKIGDAPANRVIAFEVTVGSPITVTNSNGNLQITLSTNRLELSHMAAKMEPLTLVNVPQGTYTGATLTLQNPEVTFLDNSGTPHTIQGSASQTVNLTFSPAIAIGASPVVLGIDVNVANSLTTDQAGNITGFNFTSSSFTFSTKAVAAANQQDDDGELEDTTGLVTSISGNSFTMNVGQSGAQLTFTTDSATQFSDGIADAASALNQIVKVEGTTKADGTLFASEVEGIENQNGAELEGVMTTVTGNPATTISVLAQDGIGGGMDASKVGASFTADVSGAQFKVDKGSVDTSGLGGIPGTPNFPFDATTLKAGQRVEIESTNAVPAAGGNITADKVKLQQQAVDGTVANFTAGSGGTATFDLTLAADSYLTLLSGKTSVHVFLEPGTDNSFGTISNGSALRVRGLLFWTGTSFNLIARRVTQ